ncbi:hypothetical protein QQ008_29980 [Fulvivirgaceae bacterium BMA10]|uniref:Glycosyltransferase RgtA/B/C/D-like domain-containing protein n=1 Tax=Splendidivirga corallicola TaxID=3051826 RepID=A0ABT8KXU8_9BACT|nr:hypothetical protein [Fulvivirgaceae bacterium BMA10]
MEAKDIIITPLLIILIFAVIYIFKAKISNEILRKYFFLGLIVKILGALSIGFLYQFYYEGGDTFAYHTHGSRHIWEAFMDSPIAGLKLLFADGVHYPDTYSYSSKIWYYKDPSAYNIVRISAIFDLLTFSTYSATAVLFSIATFSGIWALFLTFYKICPKLHFQLALAILFMPSVFLWGSGILKDSVTLCSLGWATYAVHKAFFLRRHVIRNLIVFLIACCLIFAIKKYILLTFLPAVIIWIFTYKMVKIHNLVLKILITPFILLISAMIAYFAITKIGDDDPRYAVENLAETAKTTAYDIAYWTGRDAGSTYELGELDGTFLGLLKLGPKAINTALFRPYLWEIKSPLMILSSMEALISLSLTIYLIFATRVIGLKLIFNNPTIIFCLAFSLVFAFAVGVSTFNFGTLSRYKIPMIPYYFTGMAFIYYHFKNRK